MYVGSVAIFISLILWIMMHKELPCILYINNIKIKIKNLVYMLRMVGDRVEENQKEKEEWKG